MSKQMESHFDFIDCAQRLCDSPHLQDLLDYELVPDNNMFDFIGETYLWNKYSMAELTKEETILFLLFIHWDTHPELLDLSSPS